MTKPQAPSVRESLIATERAHLGHAYVWGGAPGRDGLGGWDCSSMQNWVIGTANGLSIPGYADGSYDGSIHGPTCETWLQWQGQGVWSVARNEALPGDLAVWPTHMGMVINASEFISAENPIDGTRVGVIDGFIPGEPLTILRLAKLGHGGITLPLPVFGDAGQIDQIIKQIARSSQSLVYTRMALARVGVKRP